MKPLQIQAVAAVLEGGADTAREVAETTAKRTRERTTEVTKKRDKRRKFSTSGGTQMHQKRLPRGSKRPYNPPSWVLLTQLTRAAADPPIRYI
jgi:hypothetical protein